MQQLEQIKRICAFLAQVLGVGAEILVHDMQTGEIYVVDNIDQNVYFDLTDGAYLDE